VIRLFALVLLTSRDEYVALRTRPQAACCDAECPMRTIVKAAIATGFFCCAMLATVPSMAQGPYCYFDPKYNAQVCIPNHIYYVLPRRFHSSEPRSEPLMRSDWLVALLRHKEVFAGLR